jgi:hypothetical protein
VIEIIGARRTRALFERSVLLPHAHDYANSFSYARETAILIKVVLRLSPCMRGTAHNTSL